MVDVNVEMVSVILTIVVTVVSLEEETPVPAALLEE